MFNTENMLYRGACTEMPTSFKENGDIDHENIARCVEFQAQSGVTALFVNGFGSESLLMSVEERAQVVKTFVDAADKRLPVLANLMSNSLEEAHKVIEGYEKAGVTAISIGQPAVYEYTQDAIYDFYKELITSTKLPIYLYNSPESGNEMSPELSAALINDFSNVKGYKDGTQKIIHLQEVMRRVKKPDIEYVAGSDGTTLATLLLGGCGVISFITVVFPKPVIEMCEAYFAGDVAKAREKQFEILQIRKILKSATDICGYRYASELIGHPFSGTRMPKKMTVITEEEKEAIKRGLQELGLI